MKPWLPIFAGAALLFTAGMNAYICGKGVGHEEARRFATPREIPFASPTPGTIGFVPLGGGRYRAVMNAQSLCVGTLPGGTKAQPVLIPDGTWQQPEPSR